MPLKLCVVPNEGKRERKRRAKKAQQQKAPISRRDFLRMAEEDACSMYGGPGDPPPVPEKPAAVRSKILPLSFELHLKPKMSAAKEELSKSVIETSCRRSSAVCRELRTMAAVPIVEPFQEKIVEPIVESVQQTFSQCADVDVAPVSDTFESIWAEFDEPAMNWELPAIDANLVPPTEPQCELPASQCPKQFYSMQPSNTDQPVQSLHDLIDSLCPENPIQTLPAIAAPTLNQGWDHMYSRPSNLAPISQEFCQQMLTESEMFFPPVKQSGNSMALCASVQPMASAGHQSWDSTNHLQHWERFHSSMVPPVARDTPIPVPQSYQSWDVNLKNVTQMQMAQPPVTPVDAPKSIAINMPKAYQSWDTVPQNHIYNGKQAEHPMNMPQSNQSCNSGFIMQQDNGKEVPLSVPKAAYNSPQICDIGLNNGPPTGSTRPVLIPVSRVTSAHLSTSNKPSQKSSSWLEEIMEDVENPEQSTTELLIQQVQPAANPSTFHNANTKILSNHFENTCHGTDSELVKIQKTRVMTANNPIKMSILDHAHNSVYKNQVNTVVEPTFHFTPSGQAINMKKEHITMQKEITSLQNLSSNLNSVSGQKIEHVSTLQVPIKTPVIRVRLADNPMPELKAIPSTQLPPINHIISKANSLNAPKANQKGNPLAQNQIDNVAMQHPPTVNVPMPIIGVRPADNAPQKAKSVPKKKIINVSAPIGQMKRAGQSITVLKQPITVTKMQAPFLNLNSASQEPVQTVNAVPIPMKPPIARMKPSEITTNILTGTQNLDSTIQIQLENGATIHIPQVPVTTATTIAAKSRGQQPMGMPQVCQQPLTMPQPCQQFRMTGVKVQRNPPAGAQEFNGDQRPRLIYVKSATGQNIPVSFMTGPDGLITQVKRLPPNEVSRTPANRFTNGLPPLEPITPKIVQAPNTCTTMHGPVNGAGYFCGVMAPDQAVEDEEVDYEEIGVAETFAEYWPTKLKQGMPHPDAVVETATLSSVELPDITYDLSLPAHFQIAGSLSALQLEAVIYACQAHERILPSGERAGFLLGDGAGVGKGRAIAGIIYNNYLKGRKRSLWISVSNDLKFDAERDLQDIGAGTRIKVVSLNKLKYCRIDSEENGRFRKGVIFCTYTALIGESLTASSKYQARLRQLVQWLGHNFKGVIVFDECHKAKNLTMGNAGKSTKTGTTVLELQKLLPLARVVYASATGASEPKNMAYMTRLGLWGPGTAYAEFVDFVYAVERRGIGAMELVAMDMKLRGTYIARQLSFKDVTFHIQEVNMQPSFTNVYNQAAELWADISKKFTRACQLMNVDNRLQKIITCQFWCAHQRFFRNLCIASKVNTVVKMTRHAVRHGKAVVIGLQSTGESRTLENLERNNGKLTSFVSTSTMIIQSFVEKHFPAPRREAFIELLSTGEFVPETRSQPPRAKKPRPTNIDWMEDVDGGDSEDSDVEILQERWPPLPEESAKGHGRKRRGRPPTRTEKAERLTMQDRILMHLHGNILAARQLEASEFDPSVPQQPKITERDVTRCILMKEKLLARVEELGRLLPPNTLDKLISKLGGTSKVAEMTGRRGRVVRLGRNDFRYESRVEEDISMDLVNYREKQRFMEGEKFVAIISEAASSGISLQSDKRVSNQRRRLHITLELPWSADRAIQQFGRTHRSNQVNSPEYVFVITNLAGERRFASTVAKRLESLGALTQGDRRATDARDLSQFNIDNSIGRHTLEHVMRQMAGDRQLTTKHIPDSFVGNFHEDCATALVGVGLLSMRQDNDRKTFTVEKDCNNITKFLNRILGCRVEIQNAIFKFFLGNMYSLITQMKRTGRYDLGILDLDAHGASVTSVKLMLFTREHATGTAATELHTVKVERGMSFEQALAKFRREAKDSNEGFYILKQKKRNKNTAVLCLNGQGPSTLVTRKESSTPSPVYLQLYRPNTGPQVKIENLASISLRYVLVSPEEAQEYWQHQYDICLDKCSHVFWSRLCPNPNSCEVGLRVRTYHVLSGLMLPIWGRIEKIIERNGRKIQIIRVKTDVNKKIVGTLVPSSVYNELVEDLSADSMVSSNQ
ncbi:protein strawberry notch homolog 1 [Drosophila subobscura]|uniref:protein strawberry notch homolog 1 n=1 Tax=Drosophila subobscura TaxID=7241 RepID=UPI00155B3C8A|nr:protein strawberry notch homolog 1 [Drosophila subobscura]XP_034667122.1 protein strawberry notch homolog 1 [Drosophila subobscura]